MIKLTAKQKELIELSLDTEKEINDQIYFRYNNITNKVHLIKIDKIESDDVIGTFLKPVNTKVVYKLEEKGILILKKINDKLSLLTLNKELIVCS